MYDYLIAVATVNGPKRLQEFLDSVVKHSQGMNYAISICDDCSNPDMTIQNHRLSQQYGCFYTRNSERLGVPTSWNHAIQYVGEAGDSKNYIVANDDILVVPGWLHAYEAFRKANSHLKLGVLAWPATNVKEDLKGNRAFKVGPDVSHITKPIVACAGYLFGMTKQQYQAVGGFDQRYFATWEEIDFGAKLCMNGLKSIGLNGPIVWHQGGASFGDPINRHVAMGKQTLAQGQWIEKWSTVLNISAQGKSITQLITEISNALTDKLPNYQVSDFKEAEVNLDTYKSYVLEPREDIEGWFDWKDLYKAVLKKAPTGAHFVEVGTWMGKSACYMAESIKYNQQQVKFDCVDIWDDTSTEPAFAPRVEEAKAKGVKLVDLCKANLEKYEVLDYVHIIKDSSTSAAKKYADGSLDFVFIDAAHDYVSVSADLAAWWPKVKAGGEMAGHDYNFSPDGVQRAVKEFCQKNNLHHQSIGECWYMKK